jgi:hypothetical protein
MKELKHPQKYAVVSISEKLELYQIPVLRRHKTTALQRLIS